MTQALLIAALWGTTSLGGPTYAATDSTFGPEQVPFVAQEPLLCGGAAAAMVLRFWGERGVHGDDFGHLVREERGGIATTDLVEALRHWNAVSEPRIDLVEIRGARQTRHHVLDRRLGLEPGAILTEADLRLGRRRLSDVDALRRVRVSYEPLAGGDVEVRAYVQERSRWPGLRSGALRLAAAVVDRRASIEIGPLMASGDRWRADGRLTDAQAFAAGEVSTASLHLPGTVSLGLEWRRERFGDPSGGVSAEERLGGSLALREWLTPSIRAEGRLGLERWTSGVRMASAGLSAVWSTRDDGLRITGTADHWRGSALPYTRADLTVRGVRSVGDAADVRIEAGLSAASVDPPRMVWPGAGAGEVRDALLRGHPLTEDGAIRGPAFGRNLLHGTLELRAFERVGPVLLGGSAFLDAARSWNAPGAAASHRPVDPGLGAFLDTGETELRLDAAWGERGWILSAWVRSER